MHSIDTEGTMTTTPGTTTGTQQFESTTSSTTGTATDEGKRVAGVAAEEAKGVASEAKTQVRNVLDETRTQANDQAKAQRDRLVDTLRTFGDDLEQMASQSSSSGLANDLARQAADRARGISSSLEGREPSDLLQDLRGFARRRPGMFLLGALAAGVVAGRLARGAAASSDSSAATEGFPTTDAKMAVPPVPAYSAEAGVTAAGTTASQAGYATDEPGSGSWVADDRSLSGSGVGSSEVPTPASPYDGGSR
jgi:hypothetical protein